MDITIKPISKKELRGYLEIEDLTQAKGVNAIKLLYQSIRDYIEETHPKSKVLELSLDPIVNVSDNYDRLLFSKDNAGRSSTYTHYVSKRKMLRAHTTAHIPNILEELAGKDDWDDVVIMLPGLVYRRDVTDKIHLGVCHQLDIWRVSKSLSKSIRKKELLDVVKGIAEINAPDWEIYIRKSPHPYTDGGVEVNLRRDNDLIEMLECGLTKPQILKNAGLDPKMHSGWAMGMGLDRLLMTRKGIPDIRYIRSTNPRIAEQMKDLEKYHEVSNQPPISRDMSYCVPQEYVEEDVNEDIRNALGKEVGTLESVEVIDVIEYKDLPKVAKERLGCGRGQKNVLVRITLRHLSKTLTKADANKMYDLIYRKVNYGSKGYC